MDTSRIIRVGTRIYIIRMSAVSQEHLTVRTRRNITRPENDGIVLASILYKLCGWSKHSCFQCGYRNELGFAWVIEMDLALVWGSKLTC